MPATRGSNCSKGSSPSCFPMTRPSGSMNISVGQARPPKRCQTAKSRSFTTGCSMRYRSTASRKLAVSRSAGNLGEWTPTTITRSPYLLFDLPQLRKGMHAVDSTEGPEIDDCQPPAQVGDVQRPGYVEPVEPLWEVGGREPCRRRCERPSRVNGTDAVFVGFLPTLQCA